MSANNRQAAKHGGTREFEIGCAECGQLLGRRISYRCPRCDGPVILELEPPHEPSSSSRDMGVWRHRHLLPRTDAHVTLCESSTPLLELDSQHSLRVFAKVESVNPTLSFKDRAMALGVSIALDQKAPGLALASTGNAAVSAAAYAAAAGLPCRIVCGTASAASRKISIARTHGAKVDLIEGDYSEAYAQVTSFEEEGWHNVTTTYRNPFLAEAYRPIAQEIWEALRSVPDFVIVPVGAGPLIRGIWNGFRDLRSLGWIDRQPRLIAVQASACAPLVSAWREPRANWLDALRAPRQRQQTTVAGAIADPLRGYEREGLLTLESVADSVGAVVSVSDEEMVAATTTLARRGLFVEPASAATLAALGTARAWGQCPEMRTAVLVLTGHGAKDATKTPVASSAVMEESTVEEKKP